MTGHAGLVGTPASEADIRAAESRLGITFPADYRTYLSTENGREGLSGGVYLALSNLTDVVESTEASGLGDTHPGLVLIGGDGGGEAVGLDLRTVPPPVVLVSLISEGWHEAIRQAPSFPEFLAQRERGEDWRWMSTDRGRP